MPRAKEISKAKIPNTVGTNLYIIMNLINAKYYRPALEEHTVESSTTPELVI